MAALLVGAGVQYRVAQVCATAVVLFWNFIGNTVCTFAAALVEEHIRS